MKLSWSQIIFYYLFDILLLLLFLLGESFLGIYVVGAFGLFFVGFYRYMDFSKVNLYRSHILLWTIFLFGILLSSLFTHNIPQTINAVVFHLFIFSSFIFFLLIKKRILNVELLLLNLLIIVFDLGLISLFFVLAPNLAKGLPGMNLLYPTYGHNHFGALAILFIPINWYFFITSFQNKKKLIFFGGTLLFLILSLCLSFGRVVTLLGFIEVVILVFLAKKAFSVKKSIIGIMALFLVLLGGSFLAKNLFSILTIWQSGIDCPLPAQKDKLCKNISTDLRFTYWLTSLSSIAENPLLGFGPGTYKLVVEKYKIRPDAGTNYAHNAVLQIFAESGLIAGLAFLAILSTFLFKIINNLKKGGFVFMKQNQPRIEFFVSLGLLMITINCMFDFDWSFFGITFVSFILFAVILKNESLFSLFNKRKTRVLQLIYFSSLLLIITFSVLSFSVEFMLSLKKVNQAARFFPYFQNHMQLFLDDQSLSLENRKKIEEIYSQVPFLYIRDNAKYAKNWESLDEISPWHFYESNYFANFRTGDKTVLKAQLLRTGVLYENAKRNGYKGAISADTNLAKQAIAVADEFLSVGDYQSAAVLYKQATKFDNWSFNTSFPRFLFDLKTINESGDFWQKMKGMPEEYYGKHVDAVGMAHRSLFEHALATNDLEMMKFWLERIYKISPWMNDEVGESAMAKVQMLADEAVGSADWQRAEELLKILYQFNTYYAKVQLGNFYLLKGESVKADEWFKDCNSWWIDHKQETHEDCASMIGAEEQKNERPYRMVSKAIRGTK